MDSSLEKKIINMKEKSVSELAELFHCREDEICLSDYIARKTSDTVCPYKVIMGYANFEDSLVTDLGKLEVVVGKETLETNAQNQRIYLGINLYRSKIKDLKNLKIVFGTFNAYGTQIKSLAKVKFLGSGLMLTGTQIQDLGALKEVNGSLWIEETNIKSLGHLEIVSDEIFARKSKLEDVGNLRQFGSLFLGGDSTNIEARITSFRKEVKDLRASIQTINNHIANKKAKGKGDISRLSYDDRKFIKDGEEMSEFFEERINSNLRQINLLKSKLNDNYVSIRQLFEDNFIKSANGFERREINPSND